MKGQQEGRKCQGDEFEVGDLNRRLWRPSQLRCKAGPVVGNVIGLGLEHVAANEFGIVEYWNPRSSLRMADTGESVP